MPVTLLPVLVRLWVLPVLVRLGAPNGHGAVLRIDGGCPLHGEGGRTPGVESPEATAPKCPPGVGVNEMAFGVIHPIGGSQRIATRSAGHSTPSRWLATAAATWRPPSAAMSAVSAPWITLPAAKTP